MFRPKKHLKLDLLKSTPSINDLRQALEHARRLRGCTIELPWELEGAKVSFALAVRTEIGSADALWTLYTGEDNDSHVMWTAPFSDLSLLIEVISLSSAEVTGVDENTSSFKKAAEETFDSYKKNDTLTPPLAETRDELPSNSFKTEIQPSPQQENQQTANYSHLSANQANIPPQNFYPGMYPDASGSFPALPAPNNERPMPYFYYYPGYPFPIPVPYPPGMPQTVANSVPLQSGMPVVDPNVSSSRLPTPDADLLRKHTNHLIGQFLVDSGLVTDATLKIALKLQEMVVGNVISVEQAYEAINKYHNKGGALDIAQLINESPTSGNSSTATKQNHPLIGDLLVNSKIINRSLLDAILKMQEIVRAGAITKEEACQAIIKELAKMSPKKQSAATAESERELRVVDLLIRCSLIAASDKETALGVQKKHGGLLGQILVSAGKIPEKTYLAAQEGEIMLRDKEIKLEQVIIALNYCTRTRMSLSEAIKDLGFVKDE